MCMYLFNLGLEGCSNVYMCTTNKLLYMCASVIRVFYTHIGMQGYESINI